MNVAGGLIDGRYRLAGPLGRGGMGEVWLARDLRLGRRVAVKFLPRGHDPEEDAEAVARFHREAEVAAGLQHPGLVQVFDSGEQDGQLHLVMELLHGRDLATVLREEGPLPVRRAVELAAQAAEALSCAHRAGIVHRDVKPANLMLLPDDRVKVCDFGLAGFLRSVTGLTREGTVMGTPDYMSPEQCRGRQVDGRADLYALGCVLFALLTGEPPFPARQDVWAVLRDHLETRPPRLAERRPGVPAALDALVAELLAKNPADRPGFAGEVAERLRALLAPGVPTSAPAGPGYRIEVFQNEYQPADATRLDAILTVHGAALDPADLAVATPQAVVFLVGLSDGLPPAAFRAVTAAVADAVAELDEDVWFGVVEGSEYARMRYPDAMRLVRATAATRAEARAALDRLAPLRTAGYGRWLRLADRLLAGHPDATRTAVLLMDRPNEAESPAELAAVLASCAGRFRCHVRGVGEDWEVSSARAVSSALAGTVDLVRQSVPAAAARGAGAGDPVTGPRAGLWDGLRDGLRDELGAIVRGDRQARGRDLALRVAAAPGGRVDFLKQVAPTVEDLTGAGHPVGPGTTEYRVDVPDGGGCDYHLRVLLPPGPAVGELAAADLELVQLPPAGDGRILTRATVRHVPTGE
ncbi:serine/threonine-protein kinase [Kitasatospora sp. NPDC096077]|uniref:serine/threonine-protein kinase n=1 Tax=Kitasatospora sp. NPDC096077 TaxID=3155544 RepID=UPI003325FDD6